MKDAYTNAFHGVIRDAQDTHGYELPEHLEAYIVMLLSFYIDRPNWQPQASFAEAYLSIKQKRNAKELGDACLFASGVFPTLGERKGLSRSYYSNIGISSYEMVADVLNNQLFSELATHFVFLSEFIEIAVNPKKPNWPISELNNPYR